MDWIETKMGTTLSCCESCEDKTTKPMKTTKEMETTTGSPSMKIICANLSKFPTPWIWKMRKLCKKVQQSI